jgi:hypothetical protein
LRAASPWPAGTSLGTGASARPARWLTRPFRGDDRVELRPEQILVAQQQIEELLIGAAGGLEAVRMQGRGHEDHP